jgi:site-specific DNA-methyltransferase (adenine-specific)
MKYWRILKLNSIQEIKENSIHNIEAITLLEQIYEEFGDEGINMFLIDFPYTFKGGQRVTANKWDLPVDIERFFELASRCLTKDGCIALTATQPFASYLIMKCIEMNSDKKYKDINLVNFKYDWIWEKDNGSNFVHTKHQPMKVHEAVLIFGKAPTTYNKRDEYMLYNPQYTYSKPYTIKRDMSDVTNLDGFKGRTDTDNQDGKRCPRTVQKVNLERGLHPTQKPTELFEYLIKTYTNEDDLVVDLCAGSGTTKVACINTNRKYIVNDIEEKYYNIMLDRK